MNRHTLAGVCLALTLNLTTNVSAAELSVAVAANFQGTLQQLAPIFQRDSGHTLSISSGSSGALTAQILQGAPFDIFLSADQERPARIAQAGLALEGTRFTYAIGIPVLWSPDASLITDGPALLRSDAFRFLAIAEPRNAPYGAAARSVLTSLGVWDSLNDAGRIVTGNSIGQTHSQVASGAADLGFVALAQVRQNGSIEGSHWIPPAELHAPLRQDAVGLARTAHAEAVRSFLDWLRDNPQARTLIERAGYGSPLQP